MFVKVIFLFSLFISLALSQPSSPTTVVGGEGGFSGNVEDLPTGCSDGEILVAGSGSMSCTALSSGAPSNATYITQTSNATLSAEQALSSLSTGIMRVATTTGVITSLTDSAGIKANISDETGSDSLVFSTTPSITTPNFIGAAAWQDGVRQLFNPDATTPGFNPGSQAGDPSTPSDGDIWYNSSTNFLMGRINGVTTALSPCGTTTQVQFNLSGACAGDADLTFDGNFLHLGTGTTKGIRFGDDGDTIREQADNVIEVSINADATLYRFTNTGFQTGTATGHPFVKQGGGAASTPSYSFVGDTDIGIYRIGANNLGMSTSGVKIVEWGGSQDWLLQDTTATTGVTTGIVRAGAGQTDANALLATQDASNNPLARITGLGTFAFRPSANAASAATLTLAAGNVYHITGTTNITTLNTCDSTNNGRPVMLIFDDVLTFTDGNNLKLAGNFVTTADAAINLVCDGTNWYELSRSIN